ncbi:autotransporter outer membrane beta-barrel domain-containing protein, partial [Yersinia pseudotuberculosis]|uniref:autotransporter outer membrane beta-barrel domain-containing protein n=1 Tax=Yersinia pseudotuberculosis TaxID=633 RepID=UPI000AFD8086
NPNPNPNPNLDPNPNTGPDERVERPEAGSYIANLAAANHLFITRLHDRQGETPYTDPHTGERKITSLWLRNEGGHNRSRDSYGQLHTQDNRYVLQLGGDVVQWSSTGRGRGYLGLMAGYGNSKNRTTSQVTGYRSNGSVDGYSVGMYGTWYADQRTNTGWYTDSWMQYGWFNNTVQGQDLAAEDYKSRGMTASIETGYTVALGDTPNLRYFIQPQAQLIWMDIKADEHREANGTQVSGQGDGVVQSRLGVRAFIKTGNKENNTGAFQPFIAANWLHNSKDFGATLDSVALEQDGARNIVEVKIGAEGKLADWVTVSGNVGRQEGSAGYSDTVAMLGVKMNF